MSTRVTGAVFAVVLSTLAMNFGSIAKAGDLELPPYGPGPYTAPAPYVPPAQYEGPAYPGYPAPTWSAVPPEYGYGRPSYYEPFKSYYDDYLRPPAPIGRIYYN